MAALGSNHKRRLSRRMMGGKSRDRPPQSTRAELLEGPKNNIEKQGS